MTALLATRLTTTTQRWMPPGWGIGGGSPCGGIYYGEDAWPEKYRGLFFWAEWGRRVVRAFKFEPEGASFKVAETFDFVEPGGVDDFRPLDLALANDGKTMYIADWSFGAWNNKTEKLGRVYAVRRATRSKQIAAADSDSIDVGSAARPSSFNERSRAQAAWCAAARPRSGGDARGSWTADSPVAKQSSCR